ncbi:MAG: hypothetical protein A2204_03195 [Elusimicrobia bacterium RIFOXYA1_FULL_47_7]|nr:MAG: hypothetical protein A2278_01710 [Elusimicrobia bacterium RIFOXYA12_FULL_49_49]OGS09066.1 MAG: hypothetical protein A2204_03195 [Elusimicrobia bacterium RIFOXYA1_FULL_47_7]OGS11656.1 MAG: hypothetical protein A2386_03255 [Elusimicrobia bacterium RIFOXYB1_FULL_48_9]OGS16765.1 MAG: hypothetical protein A2251_05160 [Elusimicrobia bacterium RIFOXYA2_FULL_47_53]OGS31993.1 MAG: hypothetical protein A2323_07935 [Elusimicrobia bacterium RIFOXYB2_FULL_46_23]
MRVLLQNRYDALIKNGGDTFQMLMTQKYLRTLGVEADVSTALTPDVEKYDLVHLFNTTRIHETYLQYINARDQDKKVVLSPIYHSALDIANYESKNLTGFHGSLIKYLKAVDRIQLAKTFFYTVKYPRAWASFITQARLGYTFQQRAVLSSCDYLIPNSIMEIDAIRNELFTNDDRPKFKFEVVYNGIDYSDAPDSERIISWVRDARITDFVFCSGRIEPRKNQLKILAALAGTGFDVVFAGAMNKMHGAYCRKFLELVNSSPKFHYLGEVTHGEVMTLNKYSKTCVLASWFETTGLAGLEAGITGANVVVTEKGYTKEYYADKAWYCDPESESSIKNAVLAAQTAGRGEKGLKEHISALGLTWENAAKATYQIYLKTINK